MTAQEIVSIYQKLNPQQQQRFLAILAFELTIVARFGYEVEKEGLSHPVLIRAVNEMQHRLLLIFYSSFPKPSVDQ